MAATVTLVALSLLISHSNANLIDCTDTNTVVCQDSTITCMANQNCTIFCNGTGLTTKICKDAIFNCPESFTCTLICDNNEWAGSTATSGAGRICQGLTINGAPNGNLFVTATSESNRTLAQATNEIMQKGIVNCGSSSTCDVICAVSQSCEDVIITGNTNTQINFQAITLPTITTSLLNDQPFRLGEINCGTYENCNINIECLGEQSGPSAQFIGGNNAILNLFATGEDAMISGIADSKILCPVSGECNIICECTECDDTDERICNDIIINGENSNILTINAQGGDVLFDAQITCPMDSSPDECVIIINDNTDNFELTNVQIIANNGFLGFTLDCSQNIPCWTANSDPNQPTWNAPILICDVIQGLNCSIQAVNEEWNVFRCMEEGDVSLSPTVNPTISPTYTTTSPTYNPTITPTISPTVNPTITPTYNPTLIDYWIKTNDKESFYYSRRLIGEGLLCGGSSGSCMAGAIKAIRTLNNKIGMNKKGKRVVILLPDSIRNPMTKFLSNDWIYFDI